VLLAESIERYYVACDTPKDCINDEHKQDRQRRPILFAQPTGLALSIRLNGHVLQETAT